MFWCSAKDNDNIDEIFEYIKSQVVQNKIKISKRKVNQIQSLSFNQQIPKETVQSNSCC